MKCSLFIAGLLTTASQAVITTLTPGTISGLNTATASYSDLNVTLTPFIGSTPATFNANATRLGVDDQVGTNANAFNDIDIDPSNGNEEKLRFAFSPTVGLSSIAYDFSRSDGPGANDGVIITGFTADPGITFSISNASLFAVYSAGSVRINIPGSLFNGTETFINFDPNASRGQTLNMTVTDSTQAGAQLAIRSIAYDVVPEPTISLLGGLGFLALFRRRR